MLIQFIVENFLSFKDETVFSLVPTNEQEHTDHILVHEAGKKVDALPIAAFYGANASGKSNLIKAISFAKEFIVSGREKGESIGRAPFKLDPNTRKAPSIFEFMFTNNDTLYTYGFSISDNEVLEESLFAYYSSRASLLFERTTIDGKVSVNLGEKALKGSKDRGLFQLLALGALPNQLFLTEVSKRNIDNFEHAFNWFQDCLIVIPLEVSLDSLVFEAHADDNYKDFIAAFLEFADTGINGISVKAREGKLEELLPSSSMSIIEQILNTIRKHPDNRAVFPDLQNRKSIYLEYDETTSTFRHISLATTHKQPDGEDVAFDLSEESDGTLRWMNLIPMYTYMRNRDITFLVDELDRSLHPILCQAFLKSFLKVACTSAIRSQIIFTTHETAILNLSTLRRDEIYFVEKDKGGASHLTSLAEYKVRKDLKIDKGYLQGRFGAIPFLGDINQLLELEKNDS